MNNVTRALATLTLILASACNVNVDNSGDLNAGGGDKSDSDSDNSEFGACGAYKIVGEYEGGLEITADCSINYGEHALVFQQYSYAQIEDSTFRTIQTFEVDNTKTLEPNWCSAQLHNGKLFLECDELTFRGDKYALVPIIKNAIVFDGTICFEYVIEFE